jgi:hypothetical protein
MEPMLEDVGKGHTVACHRKDAVAKKYGISYP